MSERYVAEYVEIIDGNGERKGVCVTDTEHTVSFEVKDEYVARELCKLLNELASENEQLKKADKLNEKFATEMIERLQKENEQLRQDRDNWKNISCKDINKWSIFSNEVNILQETRDVDRFIEKFYKYCRDIVKELEE